MGRLDNRVIIVTGAGKHIGQAYAVRLGEEGAKVVVSDIVDCEETAGMVRETGADVAVIPCDVTSPEQTEALARQTFEQFSRIDGLVNNAGIYGGLHLTKIENVDLDEWDRTIAVNVKGTFLCCRAVVPYMKQKGRGKIVNVGSGIFLSGSPGFPHYVASKAAVMGLSRALAKELGEYGITVNTLAPGGTQSGALLHRADDAPSGRVRNRVLPGNTMPDDLTGTLVYLLSDDSNAMTGQMVVINGGDALY